MESACAVTSTVKCIAPADAAKMLERLFSHARVDQRMLHAYERDMRAGRWMLNGAPIVISQKGEVLDGRTRLLACVRAQSSFDTLIVEGIDSQAYETIDAVRKRTLADVLSIRSELHGRALAAALRIVWSLGSGITPGAGKAPSPIALLSLLEERAEIRDSVLPALRASPLLPHGCGIALHYLLSRIDQKLADSFISSLGESGLLTNVSAIAQLRNTLLLLKGKGGNRKQSYILAVSIKAWNAFRAKRPLKLLKYDPEREAFPHIEGKSVWGPLGDIEISSHSAVVMRSYQAIAPIIAEVEMITPEMAEILLSGKGPNRRVSASVINKYSRDMQSGRWCLNGQTIKISATGRLLDGQHRLEAAKKAKRAFPAIIVRGLSDSIFSSLDIGHRRSLSEVLRERGETNTIVLASSLRWLWMIRNKVVLAANSSPTNGEMLQLLEIYPEIRASLKQVMSIREIMGSGIATALHCLFSEKSASTANQFFSSLIDGVNLSSTSPIYHLRERLIRTRASHRVRLAEAERVALSIKAWNAYRDDREIQLLIWRNRGSSREPLPVVL